MKHIGRIISLAICSLAILASQLATNVQAQVQQGKAVVRAIQGTADYSVAGGPWQKLNVGKVLTSGAIVKTAAGSYVDLFLGVNGPVVRVTESTELGLDTLLFEQTGTETVIETKLDLRNGRILGNVKKLAAASKYEVKTPVSTVGIRGTEYNISADGTVHCISGEILVLYAPPGKAAAQYILQKGQTFIPGPEPKVIETSTLPSDQQPQAPPTYAPEERPVIEVKPIEKEVSPVRSQQQPGSQQQGSQQQVK